ncbi:MAG: hypothetical protein M3160_09675 [Candidatus Eremiobacteraeota bacterium]|nr:hypothetical protein [Candidatus Eremiobacteraeota bacterium]
MKIRISALFSFAWLSVATIVCSSPVVAQQAPVRAHRVNLKVTKSFDVKPYLTHAQAGVRNIRTMRQAFHHELYPRAVFRALKAQALTNRPLPIPKQESPIFDQTSPLTLNLATTQTPLPIAKFRGLGNFGFFEPPDMALAVSPTAVFQAVNDSVAVFSQTGAIQPGWPQNFGNFFSVPSPGKCDPFPFMSDPRAFYIPADGRFVASAVQVDGPVIGTLCAPLGKVWVAVSATSNPNGAWHVYAFDFGTNFPDFPQIGFDANGIYLSANLFSNSDQPSYQGAQIFGMSKASMEAGSPVSPKGFALGGVGNVLAFSVQPVETLSPATVEYFINSDVTCFTCRTLSVWAFANVLGTPSLSAVNILSRQYSIPPNADEPGCTVTGADPTACINTGDQRISATPIYRGGLISFGLNTGISGRTPAVSTSYWGQVQPTLSRTTITGGTVFQSAYLAFPGTASTYYPAVTPDANNNLFVSYGASGSTFYPEAFYSAHATTDLRSTIRYPVELIAGFGTYFGSRWGDYSAAAVSGPTGSNVWFGLEYSSNSNWATVVGETRF